VPSISDLAVDELSELTLGSTGRQVIALHGYFCRYGYFPNASLQWSYPAWQPLVSSSPSEQSTFDSNTKAAVLAFQQNAGLKPTGIIDSATWAALRHARCGVPDGIVARDRSVGTYTSNTGSWDHNTLTWRLVNTDTDAPNRRAEIENLIAAAFAPWDAVSGFTFNKVTSGADIEITFVHPPNGSAWSGQTAQISQGADVFLNGDRNWSIGVSPTPADAMDMRSVLMHELGHAVGLAHTPYSDAIMYPFYDFGQAPKTTPSLDDTTAMLAINVAFTPFEDTIVDIAYNRQGDGNEQIWVTGRGTTGGGYNIWDLKNKSSWTNHPGGATRIAVNPSLANALPWVVNDRYELFRYNPDRNSWDMVKDVCATDVGVGEDDSVWIIGCDYVIGGHEIRKLTGTLVSLSSGVLHCAEQCFTLVDGGGTRIAVGLATQPMPGWTPPEVVPWVTTNAYEILRRTSASVTIGKFEKLPGSASDIAAAGGVAWSISTTSAFGGFSIQVWDQKGTGIEGGSAPAAGQPTWASVGGGGKNISVAAGRPLVVNSLGNAHWTEPN